MKIIIKNLSYLFICIWSSYALLTNKIHERLFDSITLYTLLDTILYKNKIDIILLLILSYFHYNYNEKIDTKFYHDMKIICLFMELSSVFLGLIPFIKGHKNLEKINMIIFSITFFYSRIYYYSKNFILDKNKHNYMLDFYRKKENTEGYYIFYFIFFGFYVLNIYWFIFIIRKIFRSIIIKNKE